MTFIPELRIPEVRTRIARNLAFLAMFGLSGATFAQQSTTASPAPPPGTVPVTSQTPVGTQDTTTGAPLSKKELKSEKKTQKATEKSASENAKAAKDNAKATKHADKSTDAAQKAQQPQ